MKRILLSAVFSILLFPLQAEITPVYTSATEGSLSISTEDIWYLEEGDVLSRPVSGTLWKKGIIAERTSWLYEFDAQSPAIKIVTGDKSTTKTTYDTSSNITSVTVTDSTGAIISKLVHTFNAGNLVVESVLTEGSRTTRILYEYDGDNKLREKKRYENGELAVVYRYESDDNWTETVYSKAVPVLTVTYQKGVRVKDADEKKY